MRVEAAGGGVWDVDEREGKFAGMVGEPTFPYILGWDGAGTIVAVGEQVSGFSVGNQVYTAALPNHNGGGFYSQYAAVKAEIVFPVPAKLSVAQAGVMGWDVVTALSGLDDTLGLQPGEALMIFGASGGIGHMALQLAKRMGARVLAVASGADGVALSKRLGADAVVNGRQDDVLTAARAFAPAGLDAALVIAGGAVADRALGAVRDGGRVAYPNGVVPKPTVPPGVLLRNYAGDRSQGTIAKLHQLINAGPFEIHIARTFPLEQAAEAHRALDEHFLGKLALRPFDDAGTAQL
jgi:NADPH:quinone reductase-like Zn-dependent oxidoreductase